MGLKSTCCTCLGFFSLLGCLFYITTAIMVLRRNLVFLEHKAGLNIFTMTENELKWKFWEIAFAALVSFPRLDQHNLINVDDVCKHELLLLACWCHPQVWGWAFTEARIREDRRGLDYLRHPKDQKRFLCQLMLRKRGSKTKQTYWMLLKKILTSLLSKLKMIKFSMSGFEGLMRLEEQINHNCIKW